jgi:RNA polymerase sigma-70 factor (ECF subfamily)
MKKTRSLIVKATDAEATLAGRHEAFDELVRRFQDVAFACAYAVLRDFHLAEDAAQESFITAWRKLAQLREPEAFPGWLRRIVLTECSRLTRGKRVPTVSLEAGAQEEVASREPSPQASAEAGELRESVHAALMLLPRGERVAATLFYLEGRTHREIAELLEVTTTTVAKRLHTARAHLKGLALTKLKRRFDAHRPSRGATFAAKVRRGIFDDYLGRYRYVKRPELEVVITREGDRLFSESAGQRNELFARRKDREASLRTREFDGRGEFVRNARGRVTHFVYYEFGRELGRAKKVD